MSYLFIDTTKFLTLGLLDSEFNWVSYNETSDRKGSATIHYLLDDILKENNIDVLKLKGIFQVAGPGSYTGMRLGEGIAQIFEWHSIAIYSVYHFEVPFMVGTKSGAWVAQAFKGEAFIFSWDKDNQSKTELKPLSDNLISDLLRDYEYVFTHFQDEFKEELDCTSSLIFLKAKDLFPKILERNTHLGPFYYRSEDSEFVLSSKSS